MFDAVQFCKDYSISYRTEGKNAANGWVQVDCVFCGDNGQHLGINMAEGYCNCWKCGHHPLSDFISGVLQVPYYKSFEIIRQYTKTTVQGLKTRAKPLPSPTDLQFPRYTKELQQNHRNYLIRRKFDPDKLVKEFGLKGTAHLGDYSFRIIAPIYLNNKMISFQGRDVTGQAELRYKACKKSLEVLHHKDSLYAIDLARGQKQVLIVEGITDVWRLGKGSVSCFGIEFKKKQIKMLAKYWDTIFVLFDEEEQAQEKAQELAWMISSLGKTVEIITGIDGDPGDMAQENADYLMKDLGF